jgi:glutaredoxin-like protein
MPSPAITMYGADWCSDCRRSKALLDANSIEYTYVDVELSAEAADAARAISGRTSIPVISFGDGSHQVEPSDAELTAKLHEVGAL